MIFHFNAINKFRLNQISSARLNHKCLLANETGGEKGE
jgi:hypothetical protein